MSSAHLLAATSNLSPSLLLEPLAANSDCWAPAASAHPAEEDAVDLARLRDVVDDDSAGMRELVHLYLTESAELMGSLRAAMEAGLTSEVERVAHKLGGSSATCGMIGIVAPLRELERSGKAGQWPENEQLLEEASRQHVRICSFLAAHVLQH